MVWCYLSLFRSWRSLITQLFRQIGDRVISLAAIAFGKKSSNEEYGVNAIREKLANFETMTWREILLDAKKQNHNISVDDLVKEAQDRLTEIFPEQLDELTSLRLTGNQRVWGKVDEGVMELIWWDAEHRVCPSHKKHT